TWKFESDSQPEPLPSGAPMENTTLSEDFAGDDLTLSAELGGVFELALFDANRPDLVTAFRNSYSLTTESVDPRDVESVQFLALAAGRCTKGAAVLRAADNAAPELPADPQIAPGDSTVVFTALDRLRNWILDTAGTIGSADARSWVPECLEYGLEASG